MAKLYPPYIDGSLPAAYLDSEGWHLTITYAMNRAVALAQTQGIRLLIKTISSETVYEENIPNSSIVDLSFKVVLQQSLLNVGQYYKVQLAYIDTNNLVGYYSTIGIIKAIAKPEISLTLEKHSINFFNGEFTGKYEIPEAIGDIQIHDLSERVYSYQFNIYDAKGKLYATSGVQIHDNNTDSLHNEGLRISYDTWKPEKFGEEDSPFYTIEYKITTLNGYEGVSSRYRLQMQTGLTMSPSMIIYPLPDFENGCVEIVLIGEPDESLLAEQKYTGSYSICRRVVSDYDDESWAEIHRFRLTDQEPSSYTFRDFTVEQGVTYKYSIQQINSYGMFTSRIISQPVYADFEDMFLFDGRRALRIRFNPKVASFKTTLQESKTDTIGSKYPYFFKNGNVAYKEFPISGLLSYFIDDAELFIKDAALGLEPEKGGRGPSWVFGKQDNIIKQKVHEDDKEYPYVDYFGNNISYRDVDKSVKDRWALLHPNFKYYQQYNTWVSKRKQDAEARVRTRNFTGYNLFAERKFKLTVLDWLNNGELKLFKSPAEGNYVVRLMNNSLSPQDSLGRMIHTFTSTAYEAADNSMASLLASGIISLDENATSPVPEYQWETVWLHEGYNTIEEKDQQYYTPIKIWGQEGEQKYITIKKPEGIISFEVRDVLHYDYMSIHYKGTSDDEWEDIVIGPSGNYIMHHEIKPIDEIRLVWNNRVDVRPGHIDICFLKNQTVNFDTLTGIKSESTIAAQIPGNGKNILEDKEYWHISNWDYLKISLRPLIPVFRDNSGTYWIPPNYLIANGSDKVVVRKYDNINEQIIDDCGSTWGIYQVYDAETGLDTDEFWAWDPEAKELVQQEKGFKYDPRFAINGTPGKLDDNVSYVEYHHLDAIERLWLGTGVIAEATYQTFEPEYQEEV